MPDETQETPPALNSTGSSVYEYSLESYPVVSCVMSKFSPTGVTLVGALVGTTDVGAGGSVGELVGAGADAIMIHSRKKDPAEIIEFIRIFRSEDKVTPIVLVPTSFNTVYEEEFKAMGANVIIYANQLTRTGFPAMQNAAKLILENHRAKECDDICMSINEIINLIPEE